MGQAHHHMIRLSLDIPAEQHVHLKMLATKKGMSMREYILEALAFKEAAEEEEDFEMDNTTFRKGLKKNSQRTLSTRKKSL